MSCVSYKELKSIILKLKIKLAKIIVKNIISNTLYKIKPSILNIKYKKLIFKKV